MDFKDLGLDKEILEAVKEKGYQNPSEIQKKAIPAILQGRDVLASAQTGTGKTASFVLPLLQNLSKKPRASANQCKVLILSPTRELAAQIQENIEAYSRFLSIRSTVVFGGVKINPQMMRLRSGVEILVATPGRLLDLFQQNAVRFQEVEALVLDEADRMLDMGFLPDIKRLLKLLPVKRQNLLFSATFSNQIRQFVQGLLSNPIEIDVAPRNTAAVTVKQHIHPVDKQKKSALLSHLIQENSWPQTLVFARTKHGANKLVKQLADAKINSMAIHGNKSQGQRTKALADFKSGKIPAIRLY